MIDHRRCNLHQTPPANLQLQVAFCTAFMVLCPSIVSAQHSLESVKLVPDQVFYEPTRVGYDFNALSDEDLIALYVETYQETLQTQTIDESRLVEKGRAILQIGYSYGYDQDDADFTYQQHIFPRMQMRYRVSDRWEFRSGWAGFAYDVVTDDLLGGSTSDTRAVSPTFGVRYFLTTQQGLRPQMAITATTPFDFESDRSVLNRLNPQVSLAYSYNLGNDWYVYGSTGGVWTQEVDERFLDLQQSVGVTRLLTECVSASLDWYAIFPEGARFDGAEHYLSPGIDWMVTPRTQIGVETSFGLTEFSPDFVAIFKLTFQL